MLRFAAFQNGVPATDWPMSQLMLLGPEAVAAPGEVTFEDGLLVCRRAEANASTALSLLFDAGDAGRLSLETCLLPPREAPYLLSLELARRRVMLCLMKLEQWSLFDAPRDDPALVAVEDARTAFVRAVSVAGNGSDGFTIDHEKLGLEALSKAIHAGELLARRHARLMLDARYEASTLPDEPKPLPQVGCAVRPDRFGPGLQQVVAGAVDFISVPMPWRQLEPEEGAKQQFQPFDRWIEWAVRKGNLPVNAGPVIDFRAATTPDWLYVWENDYETLREVVYEHVKTVVTRYRRAVSRWTIVSGLNVSGAFSLTIEQAVDLTRLCALLVRKLHPHARLQVEIAQPFGEYAARVERAIPPMLYVELLFQAGISIDAIGLRLETGDLSPGHVTRDMMALADLLDHFSEFEKPLVISAMGAPSEGPGDDLLGESRLLDPGYWRRPWSEDVQADWLEAVAEVALARPLVCALCWSELFDGARISSVHKGGLISEKGQAKAALQRLADIRAALRTRRPFSSDARERVA